MLGIVSEGRFHKDKLIGKGKVTAYNGFITDGYYKDGKLCGQTTMTGPEGSTVEGTFNDNQGHGKINYSNGNKYVGNMIIKGSKILEDGVGISTHTMERRLKRILMMVNFHQMEKLLTPVEMSIPVILK